LPTTRAHATENATHIMRIQSSIPRPSADTVPGLTQWLLSADNSKIAFKRPFLQWIASHDDFIDTGAASPVGGSGAFVMKPLAKRATARTVKHVPDE